MNSSLARVLQLQHVPAADAILVICRPKDKSPEQQWGQSWHDQAVKMLREPGTGHESPSAPLDARMLSNAHFQSLWVDLNLPALNVEWVLQHIAMLSQAVYLTTFQYRAMNSGVYSVYGLKACLRASVQVRAHSVHVDSCIQPVRGSCVGDESR